MDQCGAVTEEGENPQDQTQQEFSTDYWEIDNGPRSEKCGFTK